MFSLRTHSIISAALFAALIGVAAGGNALSALGVIKDPTEPNMPMIILVFILFVAFGFSLIPVMVKSVTGAHRRTGQGDDPRVRRLAAAEDVIIWLMWAVMAAGVAVALPAMLKDGFFS
jgi:hypothetical protein